MAETVPVLALLAGDAPEALTGVAILVIAAAAIAYISARLGLVPIVGFLLSGVLIGPHALSLVGNQEMVDFAAEAGVMLLLFTLGIEFSPAKIFRISRIIFVGGTLQVTLATLATAAIARGFGLDWATGIFTGFLVALSSTAIILKLLGQSGETGSEVGQIGLGFLIFQDLVIVVMVLLIPFLAGQGGSTAAIAWALGKAALVIAGVLLLASRAVPPLLEKVAQTCSPEVFLLSVIAICFGTAWMTSLAGLSVSLGAFLAGMVVSESRFSQHALGEITPLQVLFSATFFVSVGMLLNLNFVADHWLMVAAAIAGTLIVKLLTTGASVAILGYGRATVAASSFMLAQVGEFSFVLERAGRASGIYPAGLGEQGSQAFIAATVTLMALTPLLLKIGQRVSSKMPEPMRDGGGLPADPAPEQHAVDLRDHVILAGYGDSARRIVSALAAACTPFAITTLSPWGAQEAEENGYPVLRGDSTRLRTLQLAGIENARLLVIADDDPATAHRIAELARGANRGLRILARTRFEADRPHLVHSGADAVFSEELESTVGLCESVLAEYVTDPGRARELLDLLRRDGARKGMEPVSYIDLERTIHFRPDGGASCSHASAVHPVKPSAKGCEDCLRHGGRWVHLRICMACGHVGCCDSSPGKHATGHFHDTGHPIVRSLEPGESWGWCYVDKEML